VLSADCTDVSGTTVTFSTDCSDLDIAGDGSNVTINSGVTINKTGGGALGLRNSTNTTITNNGTISATGNYGMRNTLNSTISNLTNNGTISAGVSTGLRNGIGTTITILTNTGTISAVGEYGLQNKSGTIGTITNSGTISAGTNYGLHNFDSSSTITTITNSGTISASGHNGLRNKGVITTITNTGTISAGTNYGLYNDTSGTITTLSNSGTISAGTNYAIANTGSIDTFTNTGSITPTGNTGISNQGSITTFNNSQGKSGSNPVTFTKSLPTNYNVIVNSASDYGQIEFSSFSGEANTELNFGVHTDSTLTGGETYSSVIDGLTSSNIASGTSGTVIVGQIKKNWTLENSSGNIWDLVIAADINIASNTNTSVTNSIKPNVLTGINNLNSVTEVNFANMNTYDCDLFGENKSCFSLGGRHTSISNPTTQANSFVLVSGFKVSERFRIGGFYHSNMNHKTPSTFSLSDKTPLLGTYFIWNENENKLGYQFKLANAFQKKNATLRRTIVGDSEEGIGSTVIGAESYVAELQYAYRVNDKILLKPYFSARQALIKQDAYTETGISSPLTFNKIEDKSSTILLGLKFENSLTSTLSFKGSFGVEYDINHTIDKIEPTGISGLTTVSLDNSFKSTRPVVSVGWNYYFSTSQKLSAIFQYQELAYESKTESNAYLYYTFGF